MTSSTNGTATFVEAIQTWYFTFGVGQSLMPTPTKWHTPQGDDRQCDGFPLADMYVRIRGTYNGARMEMLRRYGQMWSQQYGRKDKVKGLVELTCPSIDPDARFYAEPGELYVWRPAATPSDAPDSDA